MDTGERRVIANISRRGFLKESLILGGALGSLNFLAACTPAQAPKPGDSSAPATTAPAAPGTSGQQRRGGTLVGAFEADPVSLDPHTNSNFSSLQAYDHAYESLTAYDEKLQVVPALAERWETSDDGRTYTFFLRQNVKFHNGQAMTAEDVKYSLDRVLDPNTSAPWKSWLGPVQEVRVVNPATVQFVLGEPFPGLLSGIAGMRGSAIMPAGFAEKENLKLRAVGTGPFKLVEFVPQDHATYARNPDYWNRDLPYLEGMTFKVLSEENARLAALQAGQVQYALLSAQGVEQLRNTQNLQVFKEPYAWVGLTYINVSRPPVDDARIRRALRMSVDTNEVIQKSVYGAGVPSGPIPTGYGQWYLPPDSLPYNRPDLEGASRLLDQAGFQGGTVAIKCSPQYPEFVTTATIMQESFKKIDVDTEIVQLEWGTHVRDYQAHDYTLSNSANTFRPDPDGYIFNYFHSKGTLNAGGYRNEDLEPLIAEARAISDEARRKDLYTRIQQVLLEDSPNFWWYAKINHEAVSSRVQGYTPSFTGRQLFMREAWLSA
jgi:peptide/nickel transport system substrate-binding protein